MGRARGSLEIHHWPAILGSVTVHFFRLLLFAFSLGFLALSPSAGARELDIADTVAANPITTKMAAILQASDLQTFLSSKGPFTMFVPTDSAFAALPPGTLDALLRPENKVRLQDILLFHVVPGKKYLAHDLLPLKSLITCEGSPLALKQAKSGTQFVLKAKITHADIRCLNGIIHQVDIVLMPPEASLPPLAVPSVVPPPVVPVPPAPPAPDPPPISTTNTTNIAPVPQVVGPIPPELQHPPVIP